MKKKKIIKLVICSLIFLAGVGIAAYPFISQWYYTIDSKETIKKFDEESKKLEEHDINKRIQLAEAYNDSLNENVEFKDPYLDQNLIEAGKREYARMLEVNEQIGVIKIPKILAEIPIYAGTSEHVLQKGVGHMEGTSLPVGGNNTHAVLTAHTGLPTAKLFTDIDELQVGDKFYIKNIKETLAYQVDQIKTVEPHDFKDLVVSPGHDYVTLLTCTPYMINSHRLLVRGHRIPYVEQIAEDIQQDYIALHTYRVLFMITLAVLVIVLMIVVYKKAKNKKR